MSALNVIAHDKQLIPYRKELNAITGGVTSTILLQQLIYWWKKAGNKPFFKFMSPCGHDKYKAGDSWTEELGFSVKEFRTALRRLEDAGLVSKRTGADRVTWYTLNSELVEEQIKGQYVNAERAMVNAERAVPLNAERAVHTTNSRLPETTTDIPPNPQGGSADAPEPAPAQKPRKAIPFEQIKNLFNEILPELPTVILINKSREASIRARWNEHEAHQSLEFWQELFAEIRKSDFLMGRTLSDRPFMLTFDWLLKPSNFVKVVEGNYHG